jgi:hypothetical protein
MEIREGSRHTFCFRVEIITNLTILFVSLYFKVPQRYEMVENNQTTHDYSCYPVFWWKNNTFF